MARHKGISSLLVGDPERIGAPLATVSGLLELLGLVELQGPAALPLAPGVALLHALTGDHSPLQLRCVRLADARLLPGLDAPIEVVVVLVGPLQECDFALHVVGRLIACFADRSFALAVRAAAAREDLVRLLDDAEQRVGERSLTGDDVLALLASGREGLTMAEASRRLAVRGENRLEPAHRRPLALRFAEQFVGLFALLLWTAGIFAMLAGMPQLGWAIFAVVLINGVFSFFQEYQAERALEALERLLPHSIAVTRDGGTRTLPAIFLVPGDVVHIEEGDQVPADGQLLEAEGLRIDQGMLTGESHPLFKIPARAREHEDVPVEERHELLFAGTSVVAGRGRFVVRATGMATEIGQIARSTQRVAEEPSPLQREMRQVTRTVTVLALVMGLVFFLLGIGMGVFPVHEGFFFALGMIVANVPEGLLPTLTLALAIGVRRMARQRSLVRRLSAVEALGATTVICTDKTGTLTENRMTVRAAVMEGRTDEFGGAALAPRPDRTELFEAAVLASLATADHGDPTERALVATATDLGIDVAGLRERCRLLHPLPFDSFRKRMTLVRERDGRPIAYAKGAPRLLVALCTQLRRNGHAQPLDESTRATLLADHDRLAAEGMRILAVATRELAAGAAAGSANAIERDLILLGLVALWDPPRPEVHDAIALCRRAGIRVVMVTGDDGLTARAIGRRIGLDIETVVSGEEIARLDAHALRRVVSRPGVLFARTSPAHKLAVVEALRAGGEVVTVTGDGVNDAPALKAADVGVAMGARGSDVARQSAEMVITDDNFASIVTAVRLGRSIYANIGKFVTYIFASNVPELVPFLVSIFAHIPLPLTVMQILAVDLGTDLVPALALGAERPEPGVMDRPPRARSERLLNRRRLVHAYAFLGLIEAALALAAFFWTYWVAGWRPGLPMESSGPLYARATTMTLAAIVATQVGNVFACRTEHESVFRAGLFSNRLVLWAVVAEVAILFALILVPALAGAFGLAPLAFREWGVLLAFPVIVLGCEELRKFIVRVRARARPARGQHMAALVVLVALAVAAPGRAQGTIWFAAPVHGSENLGPVVVVGACDRAASKNGERCSSMPRIVDSSSSSRSTAAMR